MQMVTDNDFSSFLHQIHQIKLNSAHYLMNFILSILSDEHWFFNIRLINCAENIFKRIDRLTSICDNFFGKKVTNNKNNLWNKTIKNVTNADFIHVAISSLSCRKFIACSFHLKLHKISTLTIKQKITLGLFFYLTIFRQNVLIFIEINRLFWFVIVLSHAHTKLDKTILN